MNTLAYYCVAPRIGHFEESQRIFGYLKIHPRGMLLIELSEPFCRKQATFHCDYDWSEYLPDAEEYIPLKSPTPYGPAVKITAYVDADHVENLATCRSVTDILLLINNQPLV